MMTAKEIDAVAADWAARIDRGLLSTDEELALTQWMQTDARHRGAFMRMRAISLHSERARALGPAFDPDKFVQKRQTEGEVNQRQPLSWKRRERDPRRGRVRVFAAVACTAAIVIALRWMSGAQSYDTRKGEVKVVSLDDGSVMTLNTASRAKVAFSGKSRQVVLVEGEALFDVARDKTRPFVVAVGETSVRAIGTSFAVRRLADKPIQVIVREGVVEVRQPSSAAPVRVGANMRAELSMIPQKTVLQPVTLQPDAVIRELAWSDGRIAFEAETLDQAADAFARYSQIRIVIDDPVVGQKEITGFFTANDPISFAKAAAGSLGLKTEVRSGEVHLSQ